MKIKRLIEIIIILLNKECVTAKYLADKFEVSTRTIYRDINDLSSAGIPIYTNKGFEGGISLLENYTINKTMLSDNDKDNILLALKTLQVTKFPEMNEVMNKVGSIFKDKKSFNWIEVDFSPWGVAPNSNNKFENIKKALLGYLIINFDYINANNKKSNREIEPIKLYYKGRYWYLIGFCLKRNSLRIFKLSRMKNLNLTNKKFILREYKDEIIEEFNSVNFNFIKLHLRFKDNVLYRLYDDFSDEYITINNANNTADLVIELPYDEWLYSYILSFGSDVKVISPIELKEEVIKRLENSIINYI
jgi:predicted DNA-binding transcriptional regulator YafY